MIKSSLAVLVGIFAWGLAATLGNWILRAALPGYSAVEKAMAFTLTMLFWRLVLGLVSSYAQAQHLPLWQQRAAVQSR